jgi:hypothetical protein
MTGFETYRCRGVVLISLVLMLFMVSAVQAQDEDAFIVERADFRLEKNVLMLDLIANSELPEYIKVAIDQGFAVPVMFEVEIRSERAYWFDKKVVSLKQQYRLHHLPILDSFVVFDINNSERSYFDSRKAAVQSIQVVYNYPMLDINNLAAGKKYYARLRYGIDIDELPLPLKSSSFWDDDWDLQSDWYEWEVRHPGS